MGHFGPSLVALHESYLRFRPTCSQPSDERCSQTSLHTLVQSRTSARYGDENAEDEWTTIQPNESTKLRKQRKYKGPVECRDMFSRMCFSVSIFFNSPFKRGLLVIFLRQASKRCSPRRSRTDYTAVNVHAIITYWSAAILCFNSPIVAIPSSSKKECFQWTNRGFLCPRRALTIRYPGNCTAPIRLGCSLAELLPADRVRHQLHLFSRHFSGKRLLCVGI